MRCTLTKTIVGSISMVLVVTSLALARGPGGYDDSLTYERGLVIAVDDTGVATVQTDRGVEYQVQGTGWRVGRTVDCTTQDSYTTCDNRAAFVQ
jgi:hypothetical protein